MWDFKLTCIPTKRNSHIFFLIFSFYFSIFVSFFLHVIYHLKLSSIIHPKTSSTDKTLKQQTKNSLFPKKNSPNKNLEIHQTRKLKIFIVTKKIHQIKPGKSINLEKSSNEKPRKFIIPANLIKQKPRKSSKQ